MPISGRQQTLDLVADWARPGHAPTIRKNVAQVVCAILLRHDLNEPDGSGIRDSRGAWSLRWLQRGLWNRRRDQRRGRGELLGQHRGAAGRLEGERTERRD